MNTLNHEGMMVVAETFIDAYQHVISNYTQEQRDLAKRFTAELVMKYVCFTAVTPDGIAKLKDAVFGRDENRDFILTLSFVTFSRLGMDEDGIEALAKNIARSISIPMKVDDVMIPDDNMKRLASFDDVWTILKSNLWLITILLMQLFITAANEDVKK